VSESPRPSGQSAEHAPLVVRTVPVEDPTQLVALLPERDDLVTWVRRGEGLVGWGVAAVCRTSGPDRFADAQDWWATHAATAVVRDEVGVPGSGLVCFGSFAFSWSRRWSSAVEGTPPG
jgi:menaquinone-specific isochorismate synthase